MQVNPFVVGQWVRGQRFYGRAALIDEILNGPRNSLWVLGTRRIGKTSLLKQLEHLTDSEDSGFVPIFWDFQGAEDSAELDLTFSDALLDAEDRLQSMGIEISEIEGDDLFASMGLLRRKVRGLGRSLLLLCDEVEELLNLHRQNPALLRKLRRAMQSHDGLRSVLTSSVRLCALAEQRGDTSPFLHGFSPPLYIAGLTDREALSLIRQHHLTQDAWAGIGVDEAEEIRSRCDNHPYLIQLVCKRFLELGDLEEAVRQVSGDRMISYFLSVDFELLSSTEQTVLRLIAEQGSASDQSIHEALRVSTVDREDALQRLENLGQISRDEQRSFCVSGFFLRRWLEEYAPPPVPPAPEASDCDTTISVRMVDQRYTLSEEIGVGATGSVYKARDTLLDSWVALKLLRPEYVANREALDRVRQEILLSRDIAHPNILRVYHLGSSDAGTYLTMQWIEGGTLADLISESAPLPAPDVISIAAKLCSALASAHRRNVLHRDIKPSNILLDAKGEPFLADFGLARLIGEHGLTQHGLFVGTPHYASPEQVSLDPLDERSDLYALGLVIFEMATGRRPFEADSIPEVLAMQRNAPLPDLVALTEEIPGELAALILRCLAKDPADRIASAVDLEQALDRIAENSRDQKL